jgi:hypothetical protein
MNDWGTRHRVILPTPKLNSSDSQVSWGGIFCYPSRGEGHSCLVQECYVELNPKSVKNHCNILFTPCIPEGGARIRDFVLGPWI